MKVIINAVGGDEFIPVRKDGDSGYDLKADIPEEGITLVTGERKMIPCGIKLEIEDGYEGQVRPRSGLAIKHGISVINSPGTIDSSYRGVVSVLVVNHGDKRFQIHRGDRIAQLVFAKIEVPEITVQNELSETWRGEGGFGHTGVK